MRGRKPANSRYVDRLEGSPQAKERAKVVLDTMDGTTRVQEACARLDLSESRFQQIRAAMLQAAVQALEPGTAGRPAQEATPEQEQIALLQQQLAHLEAELKAAQVREEIALGLPNVVQKPAAPEKKTPRPGQLGRRPRPPKPTGA